MIEIVSASRLSERDFWAHSALGASLRRLAADARIRTHIAFENQRGLPDIFNARLAQPAGAEVLVFVHDDVWIEDYFFVDRVLNGVGVFDVIGLAGNRRRLPSQPSWAFVRDAAGNLVWDDSQYLSGRVAHGKHPFGDVSFFGAVPAECELLDGVFLAAKKSQLNAAQVRFDPRFEFHFYDMDFCRSARAQGLRLGTWPICLTHQSSGAFGSAAWHEKCQQYLAKWTT
jgi:Glycosyltransferase like family